MFPLGIPHLVPPTAPPTVNPGFIILTCGQNVTVPTLVGVSSITILCQIFNGSDPLTTTVYKDGTIVGNSVPHTITTPEFGTYTVVVSTEHCGAASAVSRILQQGQFFNIKYTIIIHFIITFLIIIIIITGQAPLLMCPGDYIVSNQQ